MPTTKKRPARRASRSSRRRTPAKGGLRLSTHAKRRLRNAALGVIVVVSTISVFGMLSLWQFLHAPLVGAEETYREDPTFNQERRYNVLLVLLDDRHDPVAHINSISLLSVDPVNQRGSIVSIPSDVDLSESTGYGQVTIASLYALGEVHGEGRMAFVVRELGESLAVPIDKYVVTDPDGLTAMTQLLGEEVRWESFNDLFSLRHLARVPQAMQTYHEYVSTDLLRKQHVPLLRFLLSVRFDKFNKLDLRRGDFDDPVLLDEKVGRVVRDERLFEERLSVQVLNGTKTPGLAGRGKRFVENLGGRVVGVGNTIEQSNEKSFILARNTESYTVQRLAEVFDIKEIRTYDTAYGIKDRADVSVVFGLDAATGL